MREYLGSRYIANYKAKINDREFRLYFCMGMVIIEEYGVKNVYPDDVMLLFLKALTSQNPDIDIGKIKISRYNGVHASFIHP